MTIEKLSELLNECCTIIDKHEKTILSTGDDYNLFSILGHTSKELTHSKIIASLLDPDGGHHMGAVFLDHFIDVVGIDKSRFDSTHSSVKTEEPIGKISNDPMGSDGGRIDIILTDRNDQKIIIENKIFAKDQYKQLIRYNQHRSDGIPILYLTPTGKDPARISYWVDDEILRKEEDFICISYECHIIKWLEHCMTSALSDNTRSVIMQYLNIVKKIVNLTNRDLMENEIAALLATEKNTNGYLDTVFEINHMFEKIQIEAQINFWKEIGEKLSARSIEHELTLDFTGKSAGSDFKEAIRACVSRYVSKGECRYFGYDVKVGSDVFLKLCVNERIYFEIHLRKDCPQMDKESLLQKLNGQPSENIKKWTSIEKEPLRLAWRYPNDFCKDSSMIKFGKEVNPSVYFGQIDDVVDEFIKAKERLSDVLSTLSGWDQNTSGVTVD